MKQQEMNIHLSHQQSSSVVALGQEQRLLMIQVKA